MKTILRLSIAIFLISLTSCNKDEDNPQIQNDCEIKNYGVMTINYSNLTSKHGVIITKFGTSEFREKISETGVAQDTLRVKPGRYILTIDRINNQNQSLESFPTQDKTIGKCEVISINTTI